MITFTGRIAKVSVKNCVDLSKTSKLEILTEEAIAGLLDAIPADQNVVVTIQEAE